MNLTDAEQHIKERLEQSLVVGYDYYYIPNTYGGEAYQTMDACVAARGSGRLVCDHRMLDKYRDAQSNMRLLLDTVASLRGEITQVESVCAEVGKKLMVAKKERDEALARQAELLVENEKLRFTFGAAPMSKHWAEEMTSLRSKLERAREVFGAIDRRAGSASINSGFTDAIEVAQWARKALEEIGE